MVMNVIERLFAMFIHIGLTVIVYYGVVNVEKGWLPAAILLPRASLTIKYRAIRDKMAIPMRKPT